MKRIIGITVVVLAAISLVAVIAYHNAAAFVDEL